MTAGIDATVLTTVLATRVAADTPLARVPFCVVDLETTGTDPGWDEITEVGAIVVRGGERLGTFHTLVGGGWPSIDGVLPSLLEFVRDTVITGHNVQFDLRFLNAALARSGRPLLDTTAVVDTMPLARKLVRDDVDDCRLGTLARRFELDHRPSHRAFEDAAATVDLLHLLIERSSAYGVVGLDDLRSLAPLAGHRHAAKLRHTAPLPRVPGVLTCHDAAGATLLVRAADDVRAAARALFDGTDARRVAPVLRDLRSCTHVEIDAPLVRRVAALRRVQSHGPAWQRRELAAHRAHLVLRSGTGRTTVARVPRDGWQVFGPMPDRATATAAAAALATPHVAPPDVALPDYDPVARALAARRAAALAHCLDRTEHLRAVRSFVGAVEHDGHHVEIDHGLVAHPSLTARPAGSTDVELIDELLLVGAALADAGLVPRLR